MYMGQNFNNFWRNYITCFFKKKKVCTFSFVAHQKYDYFSRFLEYFKKKGIIFVIFFFFGYLSKVKKTNAEYLSFQKRRTRRRYGTITTNIIGQLKSLFKKQNFTDIDIHRHKILNIILHKGGD